jgi:superfamily II DNA or RNA helicase
MTLRPYQQTSVDEVLTKWGEFNRLLGVAPTGSGKTIVFANLAHTRSRTGRVLILGHRDELIDQSRDKLVKACGILSSKEKASDYADLDARVVVASVQTLSRNHRLQRFARDHFSTIVIDEAHHCLSPSYQRILQHFSVAKVLGVTATPDRGDRQSLARFYDDVAFEITLTDMIVGGFLCPIKIKTVPLKIDISAVGMRAGDYSDDELATALEPVLHELAAAIVQHARDRKTLVFLPLVRTSYQFAEILRAHGLAAESICGESTDRKEILSRFTTGETRFLCNALLLTEGYDEPSIDCVVCLRPTTIRAFYAQMVGRGTRINPGKENLLLLDFLWLSREHNLVKPVSLIARDDQHAVEIEAALAGADGDLIRAETNAKVAREAALKQRLERQRERDGDDVDLLELAQRFRAPEIVDYKPTFRWERKEATDRQIEILRRNGINVALVRDRGHASIILSNLFDFKEREPATEKQKNFCRYLGHPNPQNLTKREAGRWIQQRKQQLTEV